MTPTNKKISESLKRHFRLHGSHWKGRKQSPSHKEKIRQANIGQRRSLSACKRMSKAKMGNKSHFGHHHSEKTKAILRSYRGAQTSNWKGGVTSLMKLLRGSARFRTWRMKVFRRDRWRCTKCGKRGGWDKKKKRYERLHADHIKPFAYFPKLRYLLSNGRTLCEECHLKTDTFGGRAQRLYNP